MHQFTTTACLESGDSGGMQTRQGAKLDQQAAGSGIAIVCRCN